VRANREDKFSAKIASGIQRKQLETTSDALLAMKRNLLAMSEGTMLGEHGGEDGIDKEPKRRKRRPADRRGHMSSR